MKNQSILIIDDNDSIREALDWSLTNKGYEILTAANGQIAWDMMEENGAPSLILLDMMMPIMDGYEFRKRKNVHPLFNEIPTVILSAQQNLKIILSSNEILIPKPFDLQFLFKIIKEHINFLFRWEVNPLVDLV